MLAEMKKKLLDGRNVLFSLGGLIIGCGVAWFIHSRSKLKQIKKVSVVELIGNTPLVYLPRLSAAAKCKIFVKLQYLNPFGSSKDRAVKQFLSSARCVGNEVVEASSGSTAISLVQVGHILNRNVTLFLPNDLAQDKYILLQTLKSKIVKVPPVSIVDENHFFNLANKYATDKQAYFTNQFENMENAQVHYQTTGPQIYKQTEGLIDCFVCSAGTGGTLAGVSKYLKEKNSNIRIVLADPEGSGLFNKVKYDVLFTPQEKEGYRLKNPFDTIIEGIGLNRPTANFNAAQIDDAEKVSDEEALHMAYYLIENEGLFVGGSSAVNLVAVIKQSRKNRGRNMVTIVHDSGMRYTKKFYNPGYLEGKQIRFERRASYQAGDLSFIK